MAALDLYTGILGKRLAAHLLRRSTYCFTRERVLAFASKTPAQAVAELMANPPLGLSQPIDPLNGRVWINNPPVPPPAVTTFDADRKQYVIGWWLNEALRDVSIRSKMSFFLHTNFVMSPTNVAFSEEFWDHLMLLRFYSLGNLKTLAKKIITDNTMMRYLDLVDSLHPSPNLNFAREFLELFTIGKGNQTGTGDYTNYTEDDILQTARVLAGWRIGERTPANADPGTGLTRGVPTPMYHGFAAKTFSYRFDNQQIVGVGADDKAKMRDELNKLVEMIYAKPETARFACRRLYRFFVRKDISTATEQDVIVPLAAFLVANNFNLGLTLTKLLTSKHFYDQDDAATNDEIVGAIIKSPLELFLQSMSYFKVAVPQPDPSNLAQCWNHYRLFWRTGVMYAFLQYCGQMAFEPPSVAGYTPYYVAPNYDFGWFNSTTIIHRYNLSSMLMEGKKLNPDGSLHYDTLGGVQLDVVAYVDNKANISNPANADILVTELLETLLPEMPDAPRYEYFRQALLAQLSPMNWQMEWTMYKTSGNATAVRIALEKLIKTIMKSQEYQFF